MENEVKLTKLAKCAGCGAKVGAGVLAQLLGDLKTLRDPNLLGGFAGERVLRAPADGTFQSARRIGDVVEAGDTVGSVAGIPMRATISGVLRGLLADGVTVHKGMKSGDVDPRGEAEYCRLVSDKALAVAGGVLEAILHFGVRNDGK